MDECPDERNARIRRDRIKRIKQDVELLEALRLREEENKRDKATSLDAGA